MHVDLDRVVADVVVAHRERLGELRLGDDASRVLHEPVQDVQLARRERDRAVASVTRVSSG